MNWELQLKKLLEEAEVVAADLSNEPTTTKAQIAIQGLRLLLARAIGILNRNYVRKRI